MGISNVLKDWPNIPLTREEAKLLCKVERNPVYKEVVFIYSGDTAYNSNPPEPLTFGDICYWMDYEANYQNYEENDGMFTVQAIRGINMFIREHSTYPIRPFGNN